MPGIKGNSHNNNGLKNSLGEYLVSHASDAIFWHEFKPESFALALAQDKLIFLNIGYLASYNCNLLHREILNNGEIADCLNKNFISILVDKEVNPDIDDIYMTARQLISKDGGWPNIIFLTPDLKPFYAPPLLTEFNQENKDNFLHIINSLAESWPEKKSFITYNAEIVTRSIIKNLSVEKSESKQEFNPEILASLATNLLQILNQIADKANGGFFGAPKFPQESYLVFLLKHFLVTNYSEDLAVVKRTLDQIIGGCLYDHIDGGFFRYTADKNWLLPNFEKLLYTQSLMLSCYLEAYTVFPLAIYKQIIEHSFNFVLTKFKNEQDLFYNGIALSQNEKNSEGINYTLTEDEIRENLTSSELELFFSYFSLIPLPMVTGKNYAIGSLICLNQKAQLATNFYLPEKVELILKKLAIYRNNKVKLKIDQKIILSNNAIMIVSLCKAYSILGNKKYLEQAVATNMALEKYFMNQNEMRIISRVLFQNKIDQDNVILEDYAWYMKALLKLHLVTGEIIWLNKAQELLKIVDKLFLSAENNIYYASLDKPGLLVRSSTCSDTNLPAENAIMLKNLLYIYKVSMDNKFLAKAYDLITTFYDEIAIAPLNYASFITQFLNLTELKIDDLTPVRQIFGSNIANDNLAKSSDFVKYKLVKHKIKEGSKVHYSLELNIEEGRYINLSETPNKYLVATRLHIMTKNNGELVEINYPSANHSLLIDDILLPVYSGKITIEIKFTKAAADLKILLSFAVGCDGSWLPESYITVL